MIRTSRILIVIVSQDCCFDGLSEVAHLWSEEDSLENAAVLQDCVWAFQWGVPVLPVRRVAGGKMAKDDDFREQRRKLRFLFALNMGLPQVGLGTTVSAALATGIRSGRSERREQLPRNIWETWQPRVIEIVGGSVTALSFRLM
ncbi:unnamed protein product [Symbiodinium pilosum]|uniref:Uncharacterized protein n=1 Tax=Symbiodinium pilosum TaxID=2952 RepID=A0A812M980_SYMPI|nr:unnamed protein product [Symbiodinium pilosum]